MQRMTIKFLQTQIANLSADITELTGKETKLVLEQGNAYISWKVCAEHRGSYTLVTGNSKNDLSDKIYAANSIVRHALQLTKGN
jgi:hypothetical protein